MQTHREMMKSFIRDAAINFLARGGSYTASGITDSPDYKGGMGYLWDVLRDLEREGIAWRAFDHEDWRTLHRWKITGCGRVFLAAGQAARSTHD